MKEPTPNDIKKLERMRDDLDKLSAKCHQWNCVEKYYGTVFYQFSLILSDLSSMFQTIIDDQPLPDDIQRVLLDIRSKVQDLYDLHWLGNEEFVASKLDDAIRYITEYRTGGVRRIYVGKEYKVEVEETGEIYIKPQNGEYIDFSQYPRIYRPDAGRDDLAVEQPTED